MSDKVINSILDAKYFGKLVDTFSRTAHYMVVLSIVFFLGGIIPPLSFINVWIKDNYTLIMVLFYTVIGYSLLDEIKLKQRFMVLLISIISFKIAFIDFTSINLLFFSFWIKLVYEIYQTITKIKMKFLKKLPPVVEEQLKEYMTMILLLIVTVLIAYVLATFLSVPLHFIQTWIFKGLNFLPIYLFAMFVMQALWTKGIHGDQVVGRVIDSLLIVMIWSNFEHLVLNIETAYTISASFHLVFGLGTGSGMTGMLLLALKIFEKKDVKELSEGTVFGISEPVIWGVPIVSNKKYRLPFILAPLLSISFGWYMTRIGFAKVLSYPVFWGTPPLLKSFLASGGDLKTVLVEFLAYLIAFIVYAVFILINKQKGDA